jgi:hypothetical protein
MLERPGDSFFPVFFQRARRHLCVERGGSHPVLLATGT